MEALTVFKMLADETRLQLLLQLAAHQELCVCDLVAVCHESQPKISRHLAMLRREGLVQCRREGAWVYYQLAPALPSWFAPLLTTIQASTARVSLLPQTCGPATFSKE